MQVFSNVALSLIFVNPDRGESHKTFQSLYLFGKARTHGCKVQSNNKFVDGTVPSNNKLFDGTVPSTKQLFDGTHGEKVPSNNKLFDGTVPSTK